MNSDETRSFRILSKNGELYLYKDGWTFNLSPPEIVKFSLPPYVEGVDWFVRAAAKIKGVSSEYMKISFHDQLFMGCDASLDGPERSYEGWIYSVKDEFLGIEPDRKIWICEHMKIYFKNAPNKIFVSLEAE
jgi:hypothetical protein